MKTVKTSFILLSIVWLFISCKQGYEDYATPSNTFRTLIEAAKRSDIPIYVDCIDHEDAIQGFTDKEKKRYKEGYAGRIEQHVQMMKKMSFTPLEEKIEGDSAHLWVEFTSPESEVLYRYWFHFVKRRDGWKLIFK